MAFTHGKNAVFKLDDSGGTLRDLSPYVDSVEGLPGSADMAETTTYGKAAKTYIPGLKDAQISVSGKYDSTATTGPDVVLGGLLGNATSSTFEFGPEGGTAGKVRYTGECWLAEYTVSAPVGDVVTWSATLQVTDAITRNTY